MSRLERGHARELAVDQLVRIAEALEILLKLTASWQGGDLDRLVNARHAALHESIARWFLGQPGWQIVPEVSYSIFGERGVIDILAWHAETRTLLVIELKTEIVDVNDLMGRVDQKRRLAAEVAGERGWRPVTVAAWVIVADSSTNRRCVARHATVLRAAFPSDGRTMASWVAKPAGAVAGLSFWADARLGSTNKRLATIKRVRRPVARAA